MRTLPFYLNQKLTWLYTQLNEFLTNENLNLYEKMRSIRIYLVVIETLFTIDNKQCKLETIKNHRELIFLI